QGAAGGIIAKVSGATQTLNGIINNIENPDLNNGGLVLTNDNNIPGLVFEPESALSIVKILAANPPVHVYSHKLSLTKSGVNQLAVISTGMNEKKVMTHDFFCVLDDCNTVSCIFDEDYCGDKFTMEVIVNNATVSPRMEVKPLLYDNNSDGWMYAIPVLDALKNGSSNDVTGYVFDGGAPDFDFFKDGDFGYIESLVYSQFLEFELTFYECDSLKVRNYFENNTGHSISFLGAFLNGSDINMNYLYEYDLVDENTIVVKIKPPPPGYMPGIPNITDSLCQLIAVSIAYPFSL
ncbi:MAG: hypothetical protein OEZ39_06630, partial [Gammaproteobacteria bacterium]|nr:hypothetical protein [Gammaproteobacteria bacterium]